MPRRLVDPAGRGSPTAARSPECFWRSPWPRRSARVRRDAPVAPSPSAPGYPQYPMRRCRPRCASRPTSHRAFPCVECAAVGRDSRRALSASSPRSQDHAAGVHPGETGLGFALLAEKQYKSAAAHFTAALAKNDRYVPALQGQGRSARAGRRAGRDRLVRAHPRDQSEAGDGAEPPGSVALPAGRQSLIEAGRKARDAGHLEDAQTELRGAGAHARRRAR